MKIVNFVAKNWLSIKEVEYFFEDGAKQIKGKNLCETDSQDSNGSGKSSFVEGITKCLFNYTSRKEIDRNLVNFDSTEAYLSTTIFCPVRNEHLTIERKFKIKGSSEAQLTIGGVKIHGFEDKMVNEIDREVLSWMDMSSEDLQNYYFISKNKFKSFFSSSNTDKLLLINRFSDLSSLDEVNVKIKKDIDKKQFEINKVQNTINILLGEQIAINKLLQMELDRDVNAEIQKKISEIKDEISIHEKSLVSLSTNSVELKDKKLFIENSLKIKKNNIKVFPKIKDSLDENIKSKTTELNNIVANINKTKIRIKEMNDSNLELEGLLNESHSMLMECERNLKGSVTCPSCSFRFVIGKENVVISEEESLKLELESIIKTTNNDLIKAKKNISDFIESSLKHLSNKEIALDKEIKNIQSKLRRVASLERTYLTEFIGKLNNELSKISELEIANVNRSKTIEGGIKLLKDSIVDIENNKDNKERIDELRITENDIQKNINSQTKISDKLNEELYSISIWQGRFDKFKMHLATKSLRIIQDYCNKSLIDMKSDMRIKLEGFKINADKKIKEEINAYIYRDGIVRSFGSFSAGERARLEYSMIIAIQNVINSSNKYGGLHFLSSDEAIEGLDSIGLDKVINSLQQFKFPILITSHIQSNFNLEKCIIFIKDNNGSRIESNINYLKQIFI